MRSTSPSPRLDCAAPQRHVTAAIAAAATYPSLLPLLILLSGQQTYCVSAATTLFDPVLYCDDNNNIQKSNSNTINTLCAYRRFTRPTPSPKCFSEDPSVRQAECRMQGDFRKSFLFVEQQQQEKDHPAEKKGGTGCDFTKYQTGLMTQVSWNGGNNYRNGGGCEATINNQFHNQTQCSSCTICSVEQELFSIDCTNIENGREMICEPILPLFYPFNFGDEAYQQQQQRQLQLRRQQQQQQQQQHETVSNGLRSVARLSST